MERKAQSQEVREGENVERENHSKGTTFGKGNGLDEEGYGRDEGEYEKDESCR